MTIGINLNSRKKVLSYNHQKTSNSIVKHYFRKKLAMNRQSLPI